MFAIGRQYGAFFCEVIENDFHNNIAYIVVAGQSNDVIVIDKSGTEYAGSCFLIRPQVDYRIICPNEVLTLFLSPYSIFADRLDQHSSGANVSPLPEEALPFHMQMPLQEIFDIVDREMTGSNLELDPRLAAVLDGMDFDPGATLEDIAKQQGISPSRLRTLAKEQIGVPLSTMFLWRKLVRATEALSKGSSLTEATHIGGFADQAHFSRTLRKMFGTTPVNCLKAFKTKQDAYYEK